MKRTFPYIIGFILMTLLASLDFVLFVNRLMPLGGRWLSFVASIPTAVLGGYVGLSTGRGLGLSHDDALNLSVIVSVVSGIVLMLFFLL